MWFVLECRKCGEGFVSKDQYSSCPRCNAIPKYIDFKKRFFLKGDAIMCADIIKKVNQEYRDQNSEEEDDDDFEDDDFEDDDDD